MEWLRKITDFIMPVDTVEDDDEKAEVKKSESTVKEPEPKVEKAAPAATAENKIETFSSAQPTGGVSTGYGSAMKFDTAPSAAPARPPLTVVENKIKELNVKIYAPTNYDQASAIASDILSKNAAVVNYEFVETAVQLRICDFLNGVCYVTDGFTDKISEKIFLYVPDGIDTVDIAEAVSTASASHFRRGLFAN